MVLSFIANPWAMPQVSGLRLNNDPDLKRSMAGWCQMLVDGLAHRDSTRGFR